MGNQQTALVTRGGPTYDEYLIDFFQFLNKRTAFRVEHFHTTDELQNTLSKLEMYKIPMNLWHAFLNGAMRVIANSSDMVNLTIEQFTEMLMNVVSIIVTYCIEYFLLKATLRILCLISPPELKSIIVALYYFLNWAGQKLWEIIHPRIVSYSTFTLNQMKAKSEMKRNEVESQKTAIKDE